MRKLWIARLLVVLAAVALMGVVIDECRVEEANSEPLRTICWSPLEAQGDVARPRLGPRACTDTRPTRAPMSR